jgi:hypothetical protein
MRTVVVAVLGLLSASAYANDAPDAGIPANGGKMVPMFTLMASRISTKMPRLPDAFLTTHPDRTVPAAFKICLGTDGHVTDVTVKMSLDFDADESVKKQIRETWLYRPQPLPVCFVNPFMFRIGNGGPTPPPPAVVPGAPPNPLAVVRPYQAPPMPPPATGEMRRLTDSFIDALMRGDYPAAYAKMAPSYRAKNSEMAFAADADGRVKAQGIIVDAKAQSTQPMTDISSPAAPRQIWVTRYAVTTTKVSDGTRFADITVARDPMLAIWEWKIIHYPKGISP